LGFFKQLCARFAKEVLASTMNHGHVQCSYDPGRKKDAVLQNDEEENKLSKISFLGGVKSQD